MSVNVVYPAKYLGHSNEYQSNKKYDDKTNQSVPIYLLANGQELRLRTFLLPQELTDKN